MSFTTLQPHPPAWCHSAGRLRGSPCHFYAGVNACHHHGKCANKSAHPPVGTPVHTLTADQLAMALRIADRHAVADIEANGAERAGRAPDGGRWYDLTPMLDPAEHDDVTLQLNRDSIEWAALRGLSTAHPQAPHVVSVRSPD